MNSETVKLATVEYSSNRTIARTRVTLSLRAAVGTVEFTSVSTAGYSQLLAAVDVLADEALVLAPSLGDFDPEFEIDRTADERLNLLTRL